PSPGHGRRGRAARKAARRGTPKPGALSGRSGGIVRIRKVAHNSMLGKLKKLFDPNEKELRRLRDMVAVINSHEPAIQALSDEDLRGKTAEFRQRLAQGATLDDLLPEAF